MQKHRRTSASDSNMTVCHMCDERASSKDHVPPKCLFPKGTANLFQAPSCDRHNGKKSKDDEYFRDVLVGTLPPSGHGTFVDVVDRSIRGRTRDEARNYSEYLLTQIINVNGSDFIEYDFTRMCRVLDSVVFAIVGKERSYKLPRHTEIKHKVVCPNAKGDTQIIYRIIDRVGFNICGYLGDQRVCSYLAILGSDPIRTGAIMSVFYENNVFLSVITT